MKKIILTILTAILIRNIAAGQVLTVNANDELSSNTKIVAVTTVGQSFFTGHQLGSTYAFNTGIFRAITDNTSFGNFFFDGLQGSNTTFSVRSDGVGYFAHGVGIGTSNPGSSLEVFGSANTFAPTAMFHVNGGQSWGHALTLVSDATNGTDDARLLFSYRNKAKQWSIGGQINTTRFSVWEDSGDGTNGNGGFGTERLTVASGGFVGIGIAAPAAQLHLFGSNQNTAALTTADNLGGAIYLQDSGGGPNNGGSAIFGAGQGGFAAIKGLLQNGDFNTIGDLAFSTRQNTADGSLTERMRIDHHGNVGIGTASPSAKLQVAANAQNAIVIGGNTGNYQGADLLIRRSNPTPVIGFGADIQLVDDATGLSSMIQSAQGNLQLFTSSPAGWNESMRINHDGSVGIGTTDTKTYKLAVNGTAIATAMTVKAYVNWPDYVFNSDYHLKPICELKAYIDLNHHLPDMPSAADVAKDGLNLGEMNKALTKKVEELTLYLIEKDQENDKQLKMIQKLEKRMAALEQKN